MKLDSKTSLIQHNCRELILPKMKVHQTKRFVHTLLFAQQTNRLFCMGKSFKHLHVLVHQSKLPNYSPCHISLRNFLMFLSSKSGCYIIQREMTTYPQRESPLLHSYWTTEIALACVGRLRQVCYTDKEVKSMWSWQ